MYVALLLTVAGFSAMTLYAFLTPTDITIWGSVLFGVSIAFLLFAIVVIFIYNKVVHMIFCLVGVILGLIYVAYDTQLIIGQKKYRLTSKDYVVGAMMLYCDFVMIFVYVL